MTTYNPPPPPFLKIRFGFEEGECNLLVFTYDMDISFSHSLIQFSHTNFIHFKNVPVYSIHI